MDANANHRPDDRQSPELSSAEYRARLLTKLNCLVAVLEVAIAKITRSIDLPGANEERLTKIRLNLENTLAICHRAKQTLERGLGRPALPATAGPGSLPATALQPDGPKKMTYRDYVELSSIAEYRKFKTLAPITADDIAAADVEALVRKLMSA